MYNNLTRCTYTQTSYIYLYLYGKINKRFFVLRTGEKNAIYNM